MSLASKISKFLVNLLSLNVSRLIPPYEYVQYLTLFDLGERYKLNIQSIGIVGGYTAKEIPKLLKNYPNSEIHCFECSPSYFSKLNSTFQNNLRVHLVNKAVSSINGESIFHETNLKGSGSLLEVGSLAKKSYKMKNTSSFKVETITLDSYSKERQINFDL